jgi:hypothetical protein
MKKTNRNNTFIINHSNNSLSSLDTSLLETEIENKDYGNA